MNERADNSGCPGWWYAGNALRPGSAQQVHQYELGIVIRVMTYGNFSKPLHFCRLFIESIAGTSAGFLETAAFLLPVQANVLPGAEAGQVELPGNGLDKGGIAIGSTSPQCMVQVSDPNVEVPADGKPIKDVQEGYGVGTSGDAHENPVARPEHFFVGNGICNSGYQGMGLAIVFVFRHRDNPGAAGRTSFKGFKGQMKK